MNLDLDSFRLFLRVILIDCELSVISKYLTAHYFSFCNPIINEERVLELSLEQRVPVFMVNPGFELFVVAGSTTDGALNIRLGGSLSINF